MDLNDILVFVKVVQAGSFSKAAKLLAMPVSTVSRRVAELEDELGVSLLMRTTRSLKITEVGAAYLAHGQAIATELEKAEAMATNLQSIPQGTLKVTASTDFGNQFLGGLVADFLKAHPRVNVDVVLTERVVDLIAEGFDLAIRVGELEDSSLQARKLGSIDMQLYASPAFLKSKGEPKSCDDLSNYDCLRFTGQEDSDRWRLQGPRGSKTVSVKGRIQSNDMALIREFTKSGQGIAMMPHFFCAEEVRAGRLKLVLKDWVSTSDPIHVVYPSQRFLLPKVRAFVDHLARGLSGVEWRGRA